MYLDDPCTAALLETAKRKLEMDSQHVPALIASTWGLHDYDDPTFAKRFRYLTVAIEVAKEPESSPLYKRIQPKLLHHRGCMAAFQRRFAAAVADFREAAKLLSADGSKSMWPADAEN